MATRPVRYSSGLTTFPPRHVMQTYPVVPLASQVSVVDDFIPYRSGDYTVSTAVAGTATTFGALAGMVKLATSASATDTIYLMRLGAGWQILPGNQAWCDTRICYPRSVANANDTNIYWGLFDNAVPTAAANGLYFIKPTGGTAVHFVIKKNNTTTTFQNIIDLALPSGVFGDTNSVNGTLTAVVAGNALTGISVATAGAGYQLSPLCLTTTASGSAGNNWVSCALGATAYTTGNPSTPFSTTALPYSSLFAPYVTNAGSGLTNTAGATTYIEVEPILNCSWWYDGKGTLFVGVNGRVVLTIGSSAQSLLSPTGVAAGATVNVSTAISPAFYSTTQLSTTLAPFQPATGAAYNLMPQVSMNYAMGFANTTANIRSLYVDEYNVAVEIN